jgi:outer membrane protein
VIAALALMTSSLSAQQVHRSLSLDEAIALAKENNPDYQQQRNDVGVARSAVRAAYGGLLPSVSANTSIGYTAPGELRFETETFGTQPEVYSSSYGVGMNLQLSGTTLLQPSVERAQSRATQRLVTGAEADLEAQVASQYLEVLRARDQIAQARREVSRADEYVRLANARLEVGAGTPLDVRRAEVQMGQAEVSVIQAENAAATAALMLGQVVGVPLDPSVELSSEFAIFQPTWNVGELVSAALEANPRLLAAEASASAARTTVSAARTSYLPSLNFNVGLRGYVSQYGSIDPLIDRQLAGINPAACERNNRISEMIGEPPQPCPDPADPALREALRQELQAQNRGFPFGYENQPWNASVSISLPIFTGFNRGLQVDQAQAASADARYRVRAEELRLRQEVASAVRNLDAGYRIALLQAEVVENASEELRLAQERFRFGAASSVEVTDAQTNLTQAERDQIEAVYNFHQSLAALEALVGRPLRN